MPIAYSLVSNYFRVNQRQIISRHHTFGAVGRAIAMRYNG